MSEVPKKQACSILCHESDRSASSNVAGICHASRTAEAAIQQTAGSVRTRPSHCAGGQRKSGPTALRIIHLGIARSSGSVGALSRIKGGATAMSNRCCTMCTESETSSNASSGEPTAIHRETIPAQNAARRHAGIKSRKTLRTRNQPAV